MKVFTYTYYEPTPPAPPYQSKLILFLNNTNVFDTENYCTQKIHPPPKKKIFGLKIFLINEP